MSSDKPVKEVYVRPTSPVVHQMKGEFNLKLGSSREIFEPVQPSDAPYPSGHDLKKW